MKITKNKSGKYRAVIRLGSKTKTITGVSRDEVKMLAAVARFDYADKKAEAARVTASFSGAAREMITARDKTVSQNTLRDYESRLRTLEACFPDFCQTALSDITTAKAQALVNDLAAPHAGKLRRGRQTVEREQVLPGCSPKTIANYWGFIHTVMKYRDVYIRPPLLPQKKLPDIYVPSDEEMKIVFREASGELSICIRLAAFGPMREGEICALDLADIKGTIVHVWKDIENYDGGGYGVKEKPKTTMSNRRIKYPEDLIRDIRKQGYVTNYSPKQLRYYFGKLLSDCDLPDFRFHDLRHYAVSTLHAQGIPDAYIMKRGGWSTDATLKAVYRHTLADQEEKMTERALSHFSDLLSGNIQATKAG